MFDAARVRQVERSAFDPAQYTPDAVEPVLGAGGRGAAWFVRGAFGAAVLRHYRRGGWMARVSVDSYLWHGEAQVRSFREFELLRRLHAMDLPVPAPLAAGYWRHRWSYQAAILVERVPAAGSFVAAIRAQEAGAPWAAVGSAIGQCHRRGARHADLNAHNILIDASGDGWLIDWDKGRLEAGVGSAWMQRVLARLQRSIRKECPGLPEAMLKDGMRALRAAHDVELSR